MFQAATTRSLRHVLLVVALALSVSAKEPVAGRDRLDSWSKYTSGFQAGNIVSVRTLMPSADTELTLDAVLIELNTGYRMAFHRQPPFGVEARYEWSFDPIALTYTAKRTNPRFSHGTAMSLSEELQPEGSDGTGTEGTENDPNYSVSGGSAAAAEKWEWVSWSVLKIPWTEKEGKTHRNVAAVSGETRWLQCREQYDTKIYVLSSTAIASAYHQTSNAEAYGYFTKKEPTLSEILFGGKYDWSDCGFWGCKETGTVEQYFYQEISTSRHTRVGGIGVGGVVSQAHTLTQEIGSYPARRLTLSTSEQQMCADYSTAGSGGQNSLDFSWGTTNPEGTTSEGGTTCQAVKNGSTGATLGTCCGSTEDIVGCALDLLEGVNN